MQERLTDLRRVLMVLALGGMFAVLVAGCHSQSYWYCWDIGDPAPHHLGHPVSGDHLCSDSELGGTGG